MSIMLDLPENVTLPPGWDTKYDFKTGKRYYVNYFTKLTSLDDPATRYKKLPAGETLSIQTYNSSPARSSSPAHFFHINQDMNLSSGRPSPIIGRSYSPLMGSGAIHYHAHKPNDFSSIDSSVIKIKALFPTVGETHIKSLLHKYHYRETIVISALQVEKHPLATPGPYSYPIATAAKHIAAQFISSAPGSPSKFISSTIRSLSPKTPRSSPKLKLRYLKNVFPVVEETVLLDTLCNSENNVHKATETLQTMGFNKRDMLPLTSQCSMKTNNIKTKSDYKSASCKDQIIIPLHEPTSREKTTDDKEEIIHRLGEKFEKMGKHIILLALDTTEYDEDRAEFILSVSLNNEKKKTSEDVKNTKRNLIEDIHKELTVVDEPDNKKSTTLTEHETVLEHNKEPPATIQVATKLQPNVNCITHVNKRNADKISSSQQTEGFKQTTSKFFSNFFKDGKVIYGFRMKERVIPKGANKSLLGQRCVAKGPNSELRVGTNSEYRKGPKVKVKGSSFFTTYAAMKSLSSSH